MKHLIYETFRLQLKRFPILFEKIFSIQIEFFFLNKIENDFSSSVTSRIYSKVFHFILVLFFLKLVELCLIRFTITTKCDHNNTWHFQSCEKANV